MTEIDIKNKILQLFNEKRKNQKSKFDESHFLDYLTFPPKAKGQIKNSFYGVRKFYRFMDCIELEFGICFTLSDLDNPNYSIDQLTKKVQERMKKRKGNIILIKQRIADKNKYYIELFLLIVLLFSYFRYKFHLISIILTILTSLIFYWITTTKINNRIHNNKLYKIIMNKRT